MVSLIVNSFGLALTRLLVPISECVILLVAFKKKLQKSLLGMDYWGGWCRIELNQKLCLNALKSNMDDYV